MSFSDTRKKTIVLRSASKTFNVGVHSDVHKSIWFKLGMTIDIIELHSLIHVQVTLFQGYRSARNFCAKYLTKFSVDLHGIWCTVET